MIRGWVNSRLVLAVVVDWSGPALDSHPTTSTGTGVHAMCMRRYEKFFISVLFACRRMPVPAAWLAGPDCPSALRQHQDRNRFTVIGVPASLGIRAGHLVGVCGDYSRIEQCSNLVACLSSCLDDSILAMSARKLTNLTR